MRGEVRGEPDYPSLRQRRCLRSNFRNSCLVSELHCTHVSGTEPDFREPGSFSRGRYPCFGVVSRIGHRSQPAGRRVRRRRRRPNDFGAARASANRHARASQSSQRARRYAGPLRAVQQRLHPGRHGPIAARLRSCDRLRGRQRRWAPVRPGNWLFHCHKGFHISGEQLFHLAGVKPPDSLASHAADDHPYATMAGLILGIRVRGDSSSSRSACAEVALARFPASRPGRIVALVGSRPYAAARAAQYPARHPVAHQETRS